MPIERSKIKAVLRSIPVDYFDGQVVNVTYMPDGMTPAKEKELARIRRELVISRNGDGIDADELADNAELLAERLAEVMVSWDVTEDGEPVQPTKENLMTFPNALLGHIISAIGEDLAPKAKNSRR